MTPPRSELMAISLWNPWAILMAIGEKANETRHWPTRHRGWLAIHAAQTWNRALANLLETDPFKRRLADHGITAGNATQANMPRGAIVAVAFVSDCISTNDRVPTSALERAFGNYDPDRYWWPTTEVRRLEQPVLCRGRQRLFRLPPDVDLAVRDQVNL